MSISLVCPKCGVRLTVGDDRAGDTFECPKCDNSIHIAAPTRPTQTKPTPPPKPEPPPETDYRDYEGNGPDEWKPPTRKQSRKSSRGWMAGAFVLAGLLILTTALVMWLVMRDREPGAAPLISAPLSTAERKTVGTWSMGETGEAETITFREDHTFAIIDTDRAGRIMLEVKGTWRVEDGTLILKANEFKGDKRTGLDDLGDVKAEAPFTIISQSEKKMLLRVRNSNRTITYTRF